MMSSYKKKQFKVMVNRVACLPTSSWQDQISKNCETKAYPLSFIPYVTVYQSVSAVISCVYSFLAHLLPLSRYFFVIISRGSSPLSFLRIDPNFVEIFDDSISN